MTTYRATSKKRDCWGCQHKEPHEWNSLNAPCDGECNENENCKCEEVRKGK